MRNIDDSRDVQVESDALLERNENLDRTRQEEDRLDRANDLTEKETVRKMEQDHIEQLVIRDFSVDPEKRLDQARDLSIVEEQDFVSELKEREPEISNEEIEQIEGFADPRDGKAFVKEGEFSDQWLTSIHEKLHQKSNNDLPVAMNEGVTEYLARREAGWVGDLHNYDKYGNEIPRRQAYDGEVAVVQRLSGLVGDDTVERAYFQGDTEKLRQHIDANLGKGAFSDICDALEKQDFQRANKRFHNKFTW